MGRTVDSYIKQMNSSADTYEKRGAKLWAQAKNGGPADGYKYYQATDCYEKAKRYRESANKAEKEKGN